MNTAPASPPSLSSATQRIATAIFYFSLTLLTATISLALLTAGWFVTRYLLQAPARFWWPMWMLAGLLIGVNAEQAAAQSTNQGWVIVVREFPSPPATPISRQAFLADSAHLATPARPPGTERRISAVPPWPDDDQALRDQWVNRRAYLTGQPASVIFLFSIPASSGMPVYPSLF